RRDAERLPVGKRKGCHTKSQAEINALLVELGREGKRVVRLKSGDPLVFGRAGEEMAALRDAGIAYEVVPGVTAAFAAAADFELPLTLRGVSSSMVFTTGHDLKGNSLPDWAKLAISGATVAVYMGRSVAAEVAGRLIEAGLSPDTAVAVVENASLANRRRFHGTLADLPSLEAEDRLEAIGAKAYAANEVVDVNLIDAEVVDGVVQPVRLREKIRAAGPTIRNDLGKQAARAA
ncbi:MAG: uroporphyrinogen-III C-methyltransferase, partial [Mesorhizobium sp.]